MKSLLIPTRLVLGAAISAVLVLSGCAIGGPAGPDPGLPADVKALDFQPLLATDDATVRLGAQPVYALLERSPAGAWTLQQLSLRPLKPLRDNQEVLLLNTALTNVYPEWDSVNFEYRSDPVSGKRSGFHIDGTIHYQRDDYALPRTQRVAKYGGYKPSNSAFGTTRVYSVIGSGTSSTFDKWWTLNENAVRKAVADTSLLPSARAFQAGDKTYAAAPKPLVPLSFPGQVWLVTPNDAERERYYFIPESFKTLSGNVIEAGSTLTTFKTPWDQVTREKAYATTVIPPYGTLKLQHCAELVVEAIGKKPSKETSCDDGDEWRYTFEANSPTLGDVKAVVVQGRSVAAKGVQRGPGVLVLDNIGKWEIRVLAGPEADAVRAAAR